MEKLRNLLGDTVIYGLGSVAQKAVSFFLLPIFTFYLSREDYGLLSLLTLTGGFLLMLIERPFSNALARFYYFHNDNPDDTRRFVGNLFYLSLAFNTAVVAIGLAVRQPIARFIIDDPSQVALASQLLAYIFVASLLGYVITFYKTMMRVMRRPLQFVVVTTSIALADLFLSLYLVAYLRQGVQGMVLGTFFATAAGSLVVGVIIARESKFHLDLAQFREAFAFGLPFLPKNLFAWLTDMSDRYILNYYVSLSAVGVYSVSNKVVSLFQLVLAAVTAAWVPVFYEWAKKQETARDIPRATRMYFLLLLFTAVGLGLFGREIILVAADIKFHDAWWSTPILAMGAVFLGMEALVMPGINQVNKSHWLAIIAGASLAINALLNFGLIPPFGIMGAAVASSLSYFFRFALTYIVSQRLFPLPYKVGRMSLAMLLGILVAFSSYLLQDMRLSLTIVLKVILFGVLGLAMIPLRLITWSQMISFGNVVVQPMMRRARQFLVSV